MLTRHFPSEKGRAIPQLIFRTKGHDLDFPKILTSLREALISYAIPSSRETLSLIPECGKYVNPSANWVNKLFKITKKAYMTNDRCKTALAVIIFHCLSLKKTGWALE